MFSIAKSAFRTINNILFCKKDPENINSGVFYEYK